MLFGIKLDDEMLLDRHGNIFPRGKHDHPPLGLFLVELQPGRTASPGHRFHGIPNQWQVAALLRYLNDISRLDQE